MMLGLYLKVFFIYRKADIKVLGILPDSSISSRNTSIIISVQSGLFKGTIFFINNNSNTTHMLVVGVYSLYVTIGTHVRCT